MRLFKTKKDCPPFILLHRMDIDSTQGHEEIGDTAIRVIATISPKKHIRLFKALAWEEERRRPEIKLQIQAGISEEDLEKTFFDRVYLYSKEDIERAINFYGEPWPEIHNFVEFCESA